MSGVPDVGAGANVKCPNCGNLVPAGEFCGACGVQLTVGRKSDPRHHAFASDPAEHVLHLSVITTLLPHLPRRRTLPFRVALFAGVLVLVVLGLLRLTGPSISVAAVLIPLLYGLYFYEVQVYEDEPWPVIGGTFGAGIVVGVPWALLIGPIVTESLIFETGGVLTPGRLLLTGVLVPVGALFLMMLGPLILRYTRSFTETLDGFTFAAASALGFTLATTLVELVPELRSGPYSTAPLATNLFELLQRGLLIPLVNASSAGLIGAALWTRRSQANALGARWVFSAWLSIGIALAAQVAIGLLSVLVIASDYAVVAGAVITVALLLWVRVAIHHMLLQEAAEIVPGPDIVCSHCHRIVPRMAFCPHCGVAMRSTPKAGRSMSASASSVGMAVKS